MPRYDSWTDEGFSSSEEKVLGTAQRRPRAAKEVEVSDVEYFVAEERENDRRTKFIS